jgi:hypothetical protein
MVGNGLPPRTTTAACKRRVRLRVQGTGKLIFSKLLFFHTIFSVTRHQHQHQCMLRAPTGMNECDYGCGERVSPPPRFFSKFFFLILYFLFFSIAQRQRQRPRMLRAPAGMIERRGVRLWVRSRETGKPPTFFSKFFFFNSIFSFLFGPPVPTPTPTHATSPNGHDGVRLCVRGAGEPSPMFKICIYI